MTTLLEKDILLIRSGETTPLESIYREVYPTSISKMRHIVDCSKEDAEDAMMDAIISLRDAIMTDKYQNQNVSAYLLTIAINRFRNKRKRDRRLTEYDPSVIEGILTNSSSSENDILKNRVNAIRSNIHNMTGKCKVLLSRSLVDGIVLKDLVLELGYSNYDVIKTSKSRCIKKLRILVANQLNSENHG